MTTYTLRKGSPAKTRTDVVAIAVAKGSSKGELVGCPGSEDVVEAYGRRFKPLLASMGFKADTGEVLRLPAGDDLRASQLLVVGVGPQDAVGPEKVRRAAGIVARNLGNAASVALALPATDAAHIRAVAEGFLSGSYSFRAYKSGADDSGVAEVAILSDAARRQDAIAALAQAQLVDDLLRQARDWVNTPPNDLPPAVFADSVVALNKKLGSARKPLLGCEVLDVAGLREQGCGGILGVGQGSRQEPRLVTLTYAPENAVATIALIGKGVTFDSGGLSIKTGAGMVTMKCDMAGAAAVLAATFAIAGLGLPVAVTAYAPMAENMPSGSAIRPGDVLTMHSGATVEVTNTDAEGRLIMADALAMAADSSADVVLDVATLTGACVTALGDRVAGVFGDDETTAAVLDAAQVSGEPMWRLPIPEQSRVSVTTESKVADVLQTNLVRWGGASFAAAFLEQFVGEKPWAHLDIAGPAWNAAGPYGHVPSGGTGFGVLTLVAYAEALAAREPVAAQA